MTMQKARIIFNDATCFDAEVFAMGNDCIGEMVFNTTMCGYQEILTDPSYSGQFVVMTYPMIGNYGINDEDVESRKIFLDALIVRDYVDNYSNWRAKRSLKSYLEENGVFGLTEVDTRALTKYIRESGAKRALITTSNKSIEKILGETDLNASMVGNDLSKHVTCDKYYQWEKPDVERYRVAVIDCGVKYNILRMLQAGGCQCDVFSMRVTPSVILNGQYDGVFVSNGPGDPEPTKSVISLVNALFGTIPLYGICLGHQILCLSQGLQTYKLKFGHHGANHPVLNVLTGRVEISSQNHGFAVEPYGLEKAGFRISHINLNDNTIAGVQHKSGLAASVQFHPEASPGPHDSRYFFKEFYELMDAFDARSVEDPQAISA